VTGSEILAALTPFMKLLAGTPSGEVLADLASLALPDAQWSAAIGCGWGDPWPRIEADVLAQLQAWDRVGRRNEPVAESYREAARAVRACVALIEERS
jgi:hypothetical protein